MSQLNYTQKSTEVLQTAQATATEYGCPQIEQCHLLYALVADPQGLASQLGTSLYEAAANEKDGE